MTPDEPRQRCLELAWAAYARGTVPVGAVLQDAAGATVWEGRSRMYDSSGPPGQSGSSGEIRNSLLAHAEVNALVRLDPNRRYEDFTLYSSLEPCPLCLGAVGMATVGRLVYLGADPYGGAVGLHRPTRHLARVDLTITGPDPGPAGRLAAALHIAFYLRRNPDGHTVAVHRQEAPAVVAAAERLLALGADEWARAGRSFDDVRADLLGALA